MCYNSIIGTDFNPRSREGSDLTPENLKEVKVQFQSTLPRGERREGQLYGERNV